MKYLIIILIAFIGCSKPPTAPETTGTIDTLYVFDTTFIEVEAQRDTVLIVIDNQADKYGRTVTAKVYQGDVFVLYSTPGDLDTISVLDSIEVRIYEYQPDRPRSDYVFIPVDGMVRIIK